MSGYLNKKDKKNAYKSSPSGLLFSCPHGGGDRTWQTESKASSLRLTAIQPNISASVCAFESVDGGYGSAVDWTSELYVHGEGE